MMNLVLERLNNIGQTLNEFRFHMWRLWAKSLGEKASKDDSEADKVAVIRTLIVSFYIITNIFIIAGVIRHW